MALYVELVTYREPLDDWNLILTIRESLALSVDCIVIL